ncbi:hypothetical protein DKX38_000350 [Salix brachista]|uniref:Uncharacterized protein n=1 Tax=Salix brachista TaxID=2182728 RepID=A0A5N5P333_9ROSI|nr:hypothetical protein DKX38_000350 [Salix brachista]
MRKPQRHYISIPTVAAEFWLLHLNFAEVLWFIEILTLWTCAIYLPDYSLTVGRDTYLQDFGFESKAEIFVACKVAKCSEQESE